MKRDSTNNGIIACGSIIAFLELVIQLLELSQDAMTTMMSLAPLVGGAIAWFGNRLYLKYSLPEHLLQQDACLNQSIKLLEKDIKCQYTPEEKKLEMRNEIADIKKARRKLRINAAQSPMPAK